MVTINFYDNDYENWGISGEIKNPVVCNLQLQNDNNLFLGTVYIYYPKKFIIDWEESITEQQPKNLEIILGMSYSPLRVFPKKIFVL